MKKNILILGIVVIGSLSSCGEVTQVKEVEDVKHVVEKVDGLVLNNGVKWTVNTETHEGMTQIKVILDNMDPLTLEDYNLLGEKCNEQTSFIISNCSMTGEAHNQLHLVLHPILDDIDNLQNVKSIEDGIAAVASLGKNISDYFTHFEI